jgi:hypothetical protein
MAPVIRNERRWRNALWPARARQHEQKVEVARRDGVTAGEALHDAFGEPAALRQFARRYQTCAVQPDEFRRRPFVVVRRDEDGGVDDGAVAAQQQIAVSRSEQAYRKPRGP